MLRVEHVKLKQSEILGDGCVEAGSDLVSARFEKKIALMYLDQFCAA